MHLLKNNRNTIISIFSLIFLIELIRTAFITDDTGITLRTVLNFTHGFGPTFNIAERVQAYTHPLWFLMLSLLTWPIGNVFYATFLLSITVSMIGFWLLASKLTTSTAGMALGLLALILSEAYVDFSTSGLENPASHLFILLSLIFAIRSFPTGSDRDRVVFFLSISCLYLTRQDLILLLSPLTLLVIVKGVATPRKLITALLVGFIPVLLWTLFSLYYYGFPFPNTAYAKLATGIAKSELIQQGIHYFTECFIIDPLTTTMIIIGGIAGAFSDRIGRCLALGILLYLIYVLNIGGDFMAGRFLTAPFLVAIFLICRAKLSHLSAPLLAVVITALGVWNIEHTLLSGTNYVRARYPVHGVDDVRGIYYQELGLISSFLKRDKSSFTPVWSLIEPRTEVTCGNMGFQSLYAGPSVHLIDLCALSDPLLARLPTIQGPWHIGHFYRSLPAGYFESVVKNKNLVTDPTVHALYDSLRLITRGTLYNRSRIQEIIRINLHATPKVDPSLFRYPINLNETIDFKSNGKGTTFLHDGYSDGFAHNGWASPEPWGVWAMGKVARLSLRMPTKDKPSKLTLTVQILTSSRIESQKVQVFEVIGGGHTAEGPFARFSGGTAKLLQTVQVVSTDSINVQRLEIVIPVEIKQDSTGLDYINLEFRFPTPLRPIDLTSGHSNDSRELTLGLISAVFD
jgi:arabinofuranosyltransferase